MRRSSLQPGNPLALYNRGNALRALGRDEEAIEAYGSALAGVAESPRFLDQSRPGADGAQPPRRSARCLSEGARARTGQRGRELQRGTGAAHRSATTGAVLKNTNGAGSAREWMPSRGFASVPGSAKPPLANKTILLHAEQGLGDTIQFVRYAPLLARAGAKVVLEVQPELKELLGASTAWRRSSAAVKPCRLSTCTARWRACRWRCKTELSSVPAEIPYLARQRAAHRALARRASRRCPSPRVAHRLVGPRRPLQRSQPIDRPWCNLQPLLAHAWGQLHQHPARAAPRRRRAALGQPRAAARRRRSNGFCRYRRGAGALRSGDFGRHVGRPSRRRAWAGRPTFCMPFQPDWRWTADRERSPWYPAVRLFRQPAPGDWNSVLKQVTEALASHALACYISVSDWRGVEQPGSSSGS